VLRSKEARPRISLSRDFQRTTSPYSSNRIRSIDFSPGTEDGSHPAPHGLAANPLDSLCGAEICRSRLAGESFGFALRRRGLFGLVWSAGSCPRGTTQPSRSRYTRARSGPAGCSEKPGGTSLPAADLPNDAAGESAAREGSPAASPTRIRGIRGILRWGVRGSPYHPLRWR
jgi:hypothetical protein